MHTLALLALALPALATSKPDPDPDAICQATMNTAVVKTWDQIGDIGHVDPGTYKPTGHTEVDADGKTKLVEYGADDLMDTDGPGDFILGSKARILVRKGSDGCQIVSLLVRTH